MTSHKKNDRFLDELHPESNHEMDESYKSFAESSGQKSDTVDGTNNTASSSTSDAAKELRDTVIRDEERAVRKVRILVGTCVAAVGLAVTIAVYFLSKSRSDQVMFELDYYGFVTSIRALVRWEVRYNFALMEQLSASTTLSAGLMNITFPFVTHPQYEITGGFVDGMGGIMSAAFAPLVTEEQREEWGVYSRANQGWIENSKYLKAVHPVHRDALHGTIQDHEHDRRRRRLQEATPQRNLETIDVLASLNDTSVTDNQTQPPASTSTSTSTSSTAPKQSISRTIYRWENGVKVPELHEPGQIFAPLWQVSPADYGVVNLNLLSDPRVAKLYMAMLKTKTGVLSSNFEVQEMFDFLFDEGEKQFKKDPHAFILQPIYDAIIEPENQTLVGFLLAITPYGNLLDRLLPEGKEGVIGVFKDDCGNTMTFELSSTKAKFLGYEDLHETKYDKYEEIEPNLEMYQERIEGVCTHDLYIYPSTKLENSYESTKPIFYTALVALAFAAVLALFILYDYVVTRRQNKTIVTALSSQAIVRSLFPDSVGKQLITEAQERQDNKASKTKNSDQFDASNRLSMKGSLVGAPLASRKTHAKLYPDATVMFADLVGFTAWSSMREPCHVFALLETIYAAFDKLAVLRRVFKVETVGDCYVAVCGLPEPQKLHHLHMARFARDCVAKIVPLLETLGQELGPDTVDLGVRVGLHSGPVTAGVLRGDRARFQLFGDTVNTTARVESTGAKNCIHISRECADLLTSCGKGHWMQKRKDTVYAKGKGELETYWLMAKDDLENRSSSGETTSSGSSDDRLDNSAATNNMRRRFSKPQLNALDAMASTLDEKNLRLANWNTEILKKLLLEIVGGRSVHKVTPDSEARMAAKEQSILAHNAGTIILDELQETIALPHADKMDSETEQGIQNAVADARLSDKVAAQLQHFVMGIAQLYRKNSFHSFEHASHVTMSVRKLLSRITSAEHLEDGIKDTNQNAYGITSDPLTQFAIVLSALIHDVDHTGVPNAQLIKEDAGIAELYRNKSVAEQNSIDLAWNLLMQPEYLDLRRIIYCTEQELDRFRKLIVNIVLATDIADKELGALRRERWNKAFNKSETRVEVSKDKSVNKGNMDRKATIVIEHIIQASDIAHTMQHWHVYKKWNSRLFEELYQAYLDGRAERDPSEGWYKGELGFFDFYIIPLAKKLKECGVFGVSSDEYLTYATQNRREWEMKGKEVVAEYKAKCEEQAAARKQEGPAPPMEQALPTFRDSLPPRTRVSDASSASPNPQKRVSKASSVDPYASGTSC